MQRYIFVAHSSAVPGREDEYNDWYVNRHLPALMQIPGVISARRYTPGEAQLGGAAPPFQYLAIIEIETDNPQTFLDEMRNRAIRGELPSSNTLAPGSTAVIWKPLA